MATQGKIWGVTTKGNVYTLDSRSTQWVYVHNQGQVLRGFKRVSCTSDGAWGLGCDHQVYVFVAASDVPIRCQVTTYENERWVPARGWSRNHLIPGVDPWQWSSEDGNVHLPKSVFKLPSDNWDWETEWSVDENVQGFLTDKGGWRYSNVDFHGHFSHQKSFKSCVRRRKWVRPYRYMSTGVWARIPSIHIDPLEEPIVDLAAGGRDIQNQLPGFVAVWIVTIDGRVLFRTGISSVCPEGQSWVDVPVEGGDEVLSLGVGPTDIVWATTWAGHLLVRTGINWQNPRGTGWLRLNAPMSEDKLVQIAAGNKAVWATTVTGHVWFRKGLKDGAEMDGLRGSGWLRMVNKMKMLAIGPHDKVWGVDYESRKVYYRLGISVEEPSGRTWSAVTVPHIIPRGIHMSPRPHSQVSMASSASSGSSPTDYITSSTPHIAVPDHDDVPADRTQNRHSGDWMSDIQNTLQTHHVKLTNLDDKYKNQNTDATVPVIGKVPKSKSAPTNIRIESDCGASSRDDSKKRRNAPRQLVHDIHSKAKARSKRVVKFLRDKITKDLLTDAAREDTEEGMSVLFSSTTSSLELNYHNGAEVTDDSVTDDSMHDGIDGEHLKLPEASGSQRSVSERSVSERSVSERSVSERSVSEQSGSQHGSDSTTDQSQQVDTQLETQPDTEDVLWLWLSASCCNIHDDAHINQWFMATSEQLSHSRTTARYQRQLSYSPWRSRILEKLKERYDRLQAPYTHYTVAIERSCWRKVGQLKWWRDTERKPKWVSAEVELVQDSDTTEKDGTFTIQYQVKRQPKHLTFSLKDISAVSIATHGSLGPVIAIHLVSRMHMSPRQPAIKLAASAELDVEDWVAALSVACCDHRGVGGAAHPHSMWSLSDRGDIFVHEPDPYLHTETATDMFWHQFGGHMRQIETCPAGVTWALAYDGRLYVYTDAYGGGFFKGMASSPHGINNQSDTCDMYVYENQRWRPISGYTDRMLFTDSHSWSDATGRIQLTKDGTKLPSKHWSWSTEWMIDRKLEGGVDKDGWQYGRKINRPFYSQPRINSVIRRRRWIRRCCTTSSGPWQEVGPHTLRDVSLQIDTTPATDRVVTDLAVWAVSSTGEVLYRTGVSRSNTQGSSWVHVPTDIPYCSISVGGGHRVWAAGVDGSVWLRHGTTPDNPVGDCWFHVSPPAGAQLTQISAGGSAVWAVDKRKRLWSRKGITRSHAEGLEWIQVAYNTRNVSCGPNNQVWVTLDQVVTSEGFRDGVICRRVGLLSDITKCGSWQYGLGGGFSHVCARAWMR